MKLSHRVPDFAWRARTTWSLRPILVLPLLLGLGIFGVGEGLLVQSNWGATPWTVLAQGLARHLGWPIGWTTALISLVVLSLWLPLRERPGLGTIANLVVIASVLDLTVAHVGIAKSTFTSATDTLVGIALIGAGTSMYLTTGLGPGPRDGLMTSLHRRLRVSVVYVRLTLEACVLLVGWILGGTVGIATVLFATSIGFSIGVSLGLLDWIHSLATHTP